MSLPFYKLVGAGNDFIFIDADDSQNISNKGDFVKEICDRQWGVGC